MKTFNMAVSRKKRKNHIVNIVFLTALYFVGYWLGKRYDQGHSPYMMAYAIPSLMSGLVFCKRFSDKVSAYLHPYTKSRKTVHYYGDDYDPAIGFVGVILKYVLYTIIGFFIFPVYSIWAVIAVLWLSFSIHSNRLAYKRMAENVYCSPVINGMENGYSEERAKTSPITNVYMVIPEKINIGFDDGAIPPEGSDRNMG